VGLNREKRSILGSGLGLKSCSKLRWDREENGRPIDPYDGGWHGAPACLDEIEANLREVLPDYSHADVKIALENYEAYRTSDLAAWVSKIDHPYPGICLDLTNSFGALESADEILGNLVPITISVHLKEFAVERLEFLMGFAFRGKPTGQGMLPLRKMFDALAAASRQANVIVEQWPPFQDTFV
jgi:3-oxoisoapionate decarboxylase